MQLSVFDDKDITNNLGQTVNIQNYATVRVVVGPSYEFKKFVIFFNTNKLNKVTGEDPSIITLSADCTLR